MASSKFHLALFLAIALIAAVPQPSAAVRPEPPTSSTTNGTQPPNPKAHPSCLWPILAPILEPILAPIFGPPTPSAPTPPPPPMPPQPKECLPTFMGLMPCKDYITNKTAPPPPYPGKCCDGLKSFMEDAPICICHLDDGGLAEVMSAPIVLENFLGLMVDICKSNGPADYGSCDGAPPVRAAPPTPAATP